MGIFSKQPDLEDEEPESEPISLYTNAPAHWPVVLTEPLIPEGIPGYDSMNVATFGAALKRTFAESNCGCTLSALMKPILFSEGIFEVPLEVKDGERLVPVFVFSSASETSAAQYYGSFDLLKSKGYSEPVYYAPSPLPQTRPRNPLRPFGAGLLNRHQGELPSGNYAMLWADDENPNILTTKCIKDIYRSFQALAGIESYVVASIFQRLKLVEPEVQRMKLPEKLMTIPVIGPEEQAFILSVSEEKGIRFHFNKNTTGSEYRDAFWSVFAKYAENFRAEAVKNQMEGDYQDGSPSLKNWANTINMLYEKGQDVAEFGVLTI